MDLANMAVAVGNGEKPPIRSMPPFATMEVEKICDDIAEFGYDLFFKGLNNVLFGHRDHYKKEKSAVEDYIERWNILNRHAKYNWQIVRINRLTLEKLMNGEIKKTEYINDFVSGANNEEDRDCGILAFTSNADNIVRHYIYATFLPEIL